MSNASMASAWKRRRSGPVLSVLVILLFHTVYALLHAFCTAFLSSASLHRLVSNREDRRFHPCEGPTPSLETGDGSPFTREFGMPKRRKQYSEGFWRVFSLTLQISCTTHCLVEENKVKNRKGKKKFFLRDPYTYISEESEKERVRRKMIFFFF